MCAFGSLYKGPRVSGALTLRRAIRRALQRPLHKDGLTFTRVLRPARPHSTHATLVSEGGNSIIPLEALAGQEARATAPAQSVQPLAPLPSRTAPIRPPATSGDLATGGKSAEDAGLERFLGPPLLIGPGQGGQADALLVLMPGAQVPANDYLGHAEALQAALYGSISLAIALVDIDWTAVGYNTVVTTTKFVKLAVEKAVPAAAAHIKLQKSRSGRYDRLFLAGHSLMGIGAVRYGLEKAAGTVLLGSAMVPSYSDLFPTACTWTRPILQVSAELDGQQFLSKQALSVLGAAESAARLGLRQAVTLHPAIVMPGLNHASFSAGGASPLDLQPDVNHDTAMQQTAELLADFLVVHCSTDGEGVTAATDALVQRQVESAAIVDPFLKALGRGSPAQVFSALQAEPYLPNPQAALDAGIVLGAFGGEVLREIETSRRWLAHPGELARAEAFAVKVQQGAVPDGFEDRVLVVATAHTDESTFLYNQPTIDLLPGGRVLVRVHVHLWRPALETAERNQFVIAPEYALKLRTASAICRALGEDDEADRQTVSHISGRKVNEATFEEALGMVTPDVKRRYTESHGKRMTFGEMAVDTSARAWVKRRRVIIRAISEREIQVIAPTYNSQPDHEAVGKLDTGYSRGIGRFMGNHYIKVISLAWAVEWLMTDSLRPADPKVQ